MMLNWEGVVTQAFFQGKVQFTYLMLIHSVQLSYKSVARFLQKFSVFQLTNRPLSLSALKIATSGNRVMLKADHSKKENLYSIDVQFP